ncbi:MAG: hypothetical protein C0413_02435 [Clostridiales bacterium]|nr:hypothetical protein [Clostridiales bacterium]
MSFYHWFSSHPNEIDLSGGIYKMQDIAKELRIVDAKQEARPKQTDFRRISSVPDIWSQHRLFEMLLLNKAEDPSYLEYESIAKREWRAMVAVLVLAESYGIKVHTQQIRFSAPVSSSYLRAAFSTRPNRELWPTMEIYYIEAGDMQYPIAMSSPSVHVIPTKDAWRNLRMVYPGRIPWITDNQVHSPVLDDDGRAKPFTLGEKETEKIPALMPVHALMLHRWLMKYREALASRQRRESDAALLQSVRLLGEFEQALSDAFRLEAQRMPNMLSFFTAAEQQDGVKIGDLHVPKNLRIFLDRAFYSVIDQASSLPEVLDTHRFAGGIGKECLVSKQQPNGKWAHFFIAMPVTEEFWKLWHDNEDLSPEYALTCTFSSDGISVDKIKASVVIGDITFSKTYNVARIDTDPWRNLCVAGIWPRQKISQWKDYYLFCNAINGYRVEPENENMITYEKTYSDKEGLEGSLNYYKLNSAPESCKIFKNNKLIGFMQIRERQEILPGEKTSVYRASIDFGTSATTLYGGVDDNEPGKVSVMSMWSFPLINTVDAGGIETSRLERYFFPPLPVPKQQTSLRQSRAEATTVPFNVLQKTDVNGKLYQDCIPLQTVLADASSTNSPRQILADSWIYFRAFMQVRTISAWPKLFSNLKWDQSSQLNQYRVQAIITQIMMMIALEARINNCGSISVTAAYPLAFELNIRDSYFEALNSMLSVTAKLTGLTIMPPPVSDNKPKTNTPSLVGSITESEAVYRYSVAQDSYNQNYFVIDIGGGSTDIFLSLIDDNHVRNSFSTSLGFGARTVLINKLHQSGNLLLHKLVQLSDLVNTSAVRDYSRFILERTSSFGHSFVEDLFAMRVDRDLSNPASAGAPENYGEAFTITCAVSSFDSSLMKSDPQAYKVGLSFLELKKRIAFYLAASIWLSGMMIRGGQNSGMNVSLLFAGNGSKMIRWLSPDLDRIRYFITLMFQQASGTAITREQMNCRFSLKPKEEVAYGALADFPTGFVAEEGAPTQQVTFGGTSLKADDLGAFHPMHYVTTNINTDFGEFASFMREYKRIAMLSFGWEFTEKEYDVNILSHGGVNASINGHQPNNGYFLNAVDVVAGFYLGNDKKDLAN